MRLPSELCAIVATIDPDVTVASTVDSDWADFKDFEYMKAILLNGTLGASATVDLSLRQATDGSGTGAKAFSPAKAITQLTQAGTDASDDQAILIARQDELDVEGGFSFVSMRLIIGTATSDMCAVMLGFSPPTYGPASNFDLASVLEIVA